MLNSKRFGELYQQETGALEDLVTPQEGFLKNYHSYAGPLTEAPELFHLFTGFALLAAVCGRNVYLRLGDMTIYPNIWIILVAPSSRCRKSTALNMGKNLLLSTDKDLLFPNEFSSEALLELLQKQPQGLFCWNEMGSILEMFGRNYMLGAKELLTDLYDSPPLHVRRLKGETIRIEKPCVSILSSSTVDWLNSKLKEGDIMSGFLARFVYVPGTKPSKLLPFPPPPNPEEQRSLLRQLCNISKVRGEVRLTKAARDVYEDWYRSQRSGSAGEADERIAPFLSRLEVYALKFAALYQISEDQSLDVQLHNFILARHLVTLLQANVRELVATEFVFEREAQDVQKVLKLIRRTPGLDRSSLLRAFKGTARRLTDALTTLIVSEQVIVRKAGKRETYYPQSSPGVNVATATDCAKVHQSSPGGK